MPVHPTPDTIPEFVAACADLTSDEIFILFEHEISPALRDAIYLMAPSDCNEPFRAACEELGRVYHVHSLLTY